MATYKQSLDSYILDEVAEVLMGVSPIVLREWIEIVQKDLHSGKCFGHSLMPSERGKIKSLSVTKDSQGIRVEIKP